MSQLPTPAPQFDSCPHDSDIRDTKDLAREALDVAKEANERAGAGLKILTGVDPSSPGGTPTPETSVLTQLANIGKLIRLIGYLGGVATAAVVGEFVLRVFGLGI